MVTADEIADPQDLRLSARVDGETRQDASTGDMIFSVAEIISYLSQSIELRPGDVIATGSPEGTGGSFGTCVGFSVDNTIETGDDLIAFAQLHGLKIGTIADLIAHRLRHDRIIQRGQEMALNSLYGGPFRMYVYTNRIPHAEHVALVRGDISPDEPVMVRMHALTVAGGRAAHVAVLLSALLCAACSDEPSTPVTPDPGPSPICVEGGSPWQPDYVAE